MRLTQTANQFIISVVKKVIEATGWYGTVAIIGAYTLTSFSILSPKSLSYQLLNLSGAAGIVVVSLNKKVYQPAVLNLIWALIALVAVFNILAK